MRGNLITLHYHTLFTKYSLPEASLDKSWLCLTLDKKESNIFYTLIWFAE